MAKSLYFSVLLCLCSTLQVCHGILVDHASCEPYEDMLAKAFKLAFDYAGRGARALGSPNSDESELAHHLFGPESKWNEAKTRLGNIAQIPSTLGNNINDRSNPKEIVVFCSMERLQPTDRKDKAWYDPFTQSYDKPYDDLDMCKTGKVIDGQLRPKAITVNYQQLDLRKPPIPVTMDLCNWYLEDVKSRHWKTVEDVPSGDDNSGYENFWSKLAQGVQKVGESLVNKFFRTEMDLAALLDQLVLHEMLHSKVSGKPQKELGEAESYGWDKCVEAGSPTNAESLAFFGLGCKFISKGYSITSQGQIKSPPSSPEGRRKRRRHSFAAILGIASTVGGAIL